MNNLREICHRHKFIAWIVVLGYIIFNGCFIFPFSNELFPFDYDKGLMVIVGYGCIGIGFAGLLNHKKNNVVLVSTLFFTVLGLVCRYILEYGEVSNTMNFIPINIALYIVVIPIYCTFVYWLICKWYNQQNDHRQ